MSISLNQNMPLGSVWVLKVPFIKGNVKHSKTEGVKKTLSTNLRRRNFVVDLWY